MLVKLDFMVGFYFLKKGTARKKKNLGIGFSLLEGAHLELAPKPAA